MSETEEIIEAIIPLAVRWKTATDRSLGITGEVGEHLACKLMGWSLAVHLQAGWDATDPQGNRIQIKSRVLQKDRDRSPTMGTLDLRKEWDQAAIVIMDDHFRVQGIWLAEGQDARKAQENCPNSDGDAKGLPIKTFKRIARQVFPEQEHATGGPDPGEIDLTTGADEKSPRGIPAPFRSRISPLSRARRPLSRVELQELAALRLERARLIGIPIQNEEDKAWARAYTWCITNVRYRPPHRPQHWDAGIGGKGGTPWRPRGRPPIQS